MNAESSVAATPSAMPTRAIVFLAVAAFAAQSMVRVTDSILPQIAADLGTTVGVASIAVTAYSAAHGSIQLVTGPVGKRFGNYLTLTIACACSTLLVMACGLAQSLPVLAVLRLACGAATGWVVPLSMAFIGDVTPYEQRQQVLGTYLSGQIAGQLFGQAAGGILGDMFGWRFVFFVLAGLLALATACLAFELVANPRTRQSAGPAKSGGLLADYRAVLSDPWARFVIAAVAVEGAAMWGAFAYVSADLHLRFGLSFTMIGLIVGAFGTGGLIYSATVRQLVRRLGQAGIALRGGLAIAAAYLGLAFAPAWWVTPVLVMMIGFGFYMLHNTLQTNATQMTPHARATAISLFSAALYLAQMLGVAAGAFVVDRFSAPPLFVITAAVLAALAIVFSGALRRRRA